jgi:hypothetical protein
MVNKSAIDRPAPMHSLQTFKNRLPNFAKQKQLYIRYSYMIDYTNRSARPQNI